MAVTMRDKPKPRRNAPHRWTPAAIRELREELGLSIEQAARKINIGWRQWYHWEAGTRNPSGPALLLLDLLKERKF